MARRGFSLIEGVAAMKSKLNTALAAAGCALVLSVGAAKATTFDLSTTLDCSGCTLAGTLVIVNNSIVSEDITFTGLTGVGPFTINAGVSFILLGTGVIHLTIDDGLFDRVDLFLPGVDQFWPLGYTGGPICGTTSPFAGCSFLTESDVVIRSGIVTVRVESGSLNPETAAAPIPNVGAALPGLILACGVLLVLARRRRRLEQQPLGRGD
jgi:hypothetical protein